MVRLVALAVLAGTLIVAAQLFAPAVSTAYDGASGSEAIYTGPPVMAHRGGAAEAPENTMVAFEHALRRGVHWLEMDVHPSADGVPVVIHDATLDRTTDCTGPVNERTVAELRQCNACAAFCDGRTFVGISTFEEVLERFRNERVAINVEIKNVPTEPDTFDPLDLVLVPAMVDAIRAHPEYVEENRLLVSSFNFRTTAELKRVAPEIPVALLTLNPADAHGELAYAAATDHAAIQPSWEGLREETAAQFVQDAHALGLLVHPWTVDDPATMRRLAEAGVDGVITNKPSLMLETFHGT